MATSKLEFLNTLELFLITLIADEKKFDLSKEKLDKVKGEFKDLLGIDEELTNADYINALGAILIHHHKGFIFMETLRESGLDNLIDCRNVITFYEQNN
jgi:hypothetical protein